MRNILMFGPAFGHNIKPFLKYYNEHDDVKLTLVYSGENTHQSEFPKVNFIRLTTLTLLTILTAIIKGRYDVLWLHGGNRLSIPLGIFLKLFKPRLFSVFNLWGEGVLKHCEQSKVYFLLAKYALPGFKLIQCNWYTLEQKFKTKFPGLPTKTLLWGISESYFEKNERSAIRKEIDTLVSVSKYKFFFPKTISSHSEHCLLITAFSELRGLNWHLFLLEGNGRDEQLYSKLIKDIEDSGLTKQVTFLKFSDYLQPSEMGYLWSKMDCGLQIVKNDQLSNTLVEPIVFGKDVLASNIPQYKDFNEYFNVDVNLVENNASALLVELRNKISHVEVNSKVLKERMSIIKEQYCFENNVKKIHTFHESAELAIKSRD